MHHTIIPNQNLYLNQCARLGVWSCIMLRISRIYNAQIKSLHPFSYKNGTAGIAGSGDSRNSCLFGTAIDGDQNPGDDPQMTTKHARTLINKLTIILHNWSNVFLSIKFISLSSLGLHSNSHPEGWWARAEPPDLSQLFHMLQVHEHTSFSHVTNLSLEDEQRWDLFLCEIISGIFVS